MEEFYKKLVELRRRLNWSQTKLAAQLNVSLPTVQRWEANKTKPHALALASVSSLVSSLGFDDLKVDLYPITSAIITGTATSIKEKPCSITGLLKNFKQRLLILSNFNSGKLLESLYPNDHFSKDDVAFGYLKNNKFVSASDFKHPGIEIGYIAHILLLVGLGYAKDETDIAPKVDYLIRGIVKAELNQDVIFWETPGQLLESPKNFSALQSCLKQLLKRNLITSENKVYGSGNGAGMALGTVAQILGVK